MEESKAGPGDVKETAEAKRARSLANLRPAVKGEAPRNPNGNNGRRRHELVAAILDEKDDDDPAVPGCTRIRSVVLSLVKHAKSGEASAPGAAKTLIEHYGGKAKPDPNTEALDVAEHFRRVEKDRVDSALVLLAARKGELTEESIKAVLDACEREPDHFHKLASEKVSTEDEEPKDDE